MISITPAIKSLKIRNLGMVRKADFEFTKGINIIYGVNGSGKTTVVNAIRHLTNGEKLIYGPNKYMKPSEKSVIEAELLGENLITEVKEEPSVYEQCLRKRLLPDLTKLPPAIKSVEDMKAWMSGGERDFMELLEAVRVSNKGHALLLDDAFAHLDHVNKNAIFELLKRSELQVIMTVRREDELVKGANILRLRLLKNVKGVYSGT